MWRPVYETEYRDASYDRIRYVSETAEREERYTTYQTAYETAEAAKCTAPRCGPSSKRFTGRNTPR